MSEFGRENQLPMSPAWHSFINDQSDDRCQFIVGAMKCLNPITTFTHFSINCTITVPSLDSLPDAGTIGACVSKHIVLYHINRMIISCQAECEIQLQRVEWFLFFKELDGFIVGCFSFYGCDSSSFQFDKFILNKTFHQFFDFFRELLWVCPSVVDFIEERGDRERR